MLGYLLLTPPKTLPYVLLGLVAAAALASSPALAADVLPLGTLDARQTGTVEGGDVGAAGEVAGQLRVDGGSAYVGAGQLGPSGTRSAELLQHVDRASALLGFTLAKNLSLSLGLHGTSESVDPLDRDALSPGQASAWRTGLKQTGFSDASLLLKFRIVNGGGTQIALAPFVESGAGEGATYALTRSVDPQGGVMAIATAGQEGEAQLNLNLGIRYRDPESIGDVTLRHEQIAKLGATFWIVPSVSVFGAYEGRNLMVAHAGDVDASGALRYDQELGTAASVGLGVQLSDTASLSAYGQKGTHASPGAFGYAGESYGAALNVTLGDLRRHRASYAEEIEREEDAKARAQAAQEAALKAKAPPPRATLDPQHPELDDTPPPASFADFELSSPDAVGEDFKDVDKRAQQLRKDADGEGEDARIERELKAIKAAEAKAEAERAKEEAAGKEERAAAAMKQDQEDQKLMHEWMDEAQKKADELPGIDDDQMKWNGLGN